MLTPQEVSEHVFAKSAFGGYNMTMVDEFLDELTDDYTALYKENTALKAKMKVLVDKVEEYRATEDSMRSALLAAQKMASNMVSEAEERKETMLADAEMEARARVGALHDEIVNEQKKLNAIKAQTREFVENTRAVCERQLRQLEALPDLTPEEVEKTTNEAKAARESEADIAALSEKIVASYERERDNTATAVYAPQKAKEPGEQRRDTVMFNAVKRETAPQSAEKAEPVDRSHDDAATRPLKFVDKLSEMKLADLKFGRNYSADDT